MSEKKKGLSLTVFFFSSSSVRITKAILVALTLFLLIVLSKKFRYAKRDAPVDLFSELESGDGRIGEDGRRTWDGTTQGSRIRGLVDNEEDDSNRGEYI